MLTDRIAQALKRTYDKVLREPVPQKLTDLLERLK
jgi:hypothetical protein